MKPKKRKKVINLVGYLLPYIPNLDIYGENAIVLCNKTAFPKNTIKKFHIKCEEL